MSDLVERLRQYAAALPYGSDTYSGKKRDLDAAADEIERLQKTGQVDRSFAQDAIATLAAERDALRAEVARYREALLYVLDLFGHEKDPLAIQLCDNTRHVLGPAKPGCEQFPPPPSESK